MKEIWKTIKDYEDYEVSNFGRIKSHRQKKDKILKPSIGKFGYYRYGLYNKYNKNKKMFLNRIVAETFLDKNDFKSMPYEDRNKINLDNLQVNHKNGIKTDNRIDNLEWCTSSYNLVHAFSLNLKKPKLNESNKHSKSINQYDLEGNLIRMWANKRQIERELGFSSWNITNCCKGKIEKAYNYIWKYIEE